MSEVFEVFEVFEVVIPWVPPVDANPNWHKNSERTKIKRRRVGAAQATHPIRDERKRWEPADGPLFDAPVYLDVVIRWPARRNRWDTDAVVTCLKFVRDVLEREGVVSNDRLIQTGDIVQERATGQEETVLRLRAVT